MSKHFRQSCYDEDSLGPDPYEAMKKPRYECHQCGNFDHMDDDNERIVTDWFDGSRITVLICDRCLRLGWDKWGRP